MRFGAEPDLRLRLSMATAADLGLTGRRQSLTDQAKPKIAMAGTAYPVRFAPCPPRSAARLLAGERSTGNHTHVPAHPHLSSFRLFRMVSKCFRDWTRLLHPTYHGHARSDYGWRRCAEKQKVRRHQRALADSLYIRNHSAWDTLSRSWVAWEVGLLVFCLASG